MKRLHRLRRTARVWGMDLLQALTGSRDPEVPPARMQRFSPVDFRGTGRSLAAMLVRHGLEPHHRVLDIGCGTGRVALGLTEVLGERGRYEGFDADAPAIRWCREHLTPRHPQFQFFHADVAAAGFHRSGQDAAEYRFPWSDATFDFAFATSVFTHMPFEATRHYIAEARRSLRPGGIFLATVFVLDERPGRLAFPIPRGPLFLMEEKNPNRGVAWPQATIAQLFPEPGWSEVEISFGNWRETGAFATSGQDVVTARAK